MKTKPKCFISYEWNDVDNYFLLLLKEYIEKDKRINVILDTASFNIGDDLIENEKQLSSSDVIIVFLSENYKIKIDNGTNSGVSREYALLKELIDNKEKKILPILYSGSLDSSVPDEFKNKIYLDLSCINPKIITEYKTIEFNNAIQSKIKTLVDTVKNQAEIITWSKNPVFMNMDEEYNALFINTNAVHIPRECIIETKAYEAVKKQSVLFILGRKGSGKTTLLETLRKYDAEYYFNKYKISEPINAEHLKLQLFYEMVIKEYKSSIGELQLTRIIEIFWTVFLFLHCAYDIAVEFDRGKINKSDSRYETFRKATYRLKIALGRKGKSIDDADCRMHIFTLATELIYNHLKTGIFDNANVDTILTTTNINFNAQSILVKLYGVVLFSKFCDAVMECEKKILIALDGFDPYSEDFRRATNKLKEIDYQEYVLRKDFEIWFYRELLILALKVKESKIDGKIGQVFSIIDFCIIIPQDRYDEIKEEDRDSIKRNYCCLSWDAHDLMLMIVKRLEQYFKDSSKKLESLRSRFDYLIKKYLPNIPTEIMVEINDHDMPIHLFNYLLRLSFWRPRDILTNFAVVLKVSREVKEQNEKIIQGILKKLLIKNVRETIETEFIKEYKNVYNNLDFVLQYFEKSNLITDFKEFYESLANIQIDSVYTENCITNEDKLYILYKMGVIGLYCDKTEAMEHGYGFHICYIFNEGLQPLDDLMKGEKYLKTRSKIIFNPIFSKFLMLKMNTNEIIMNFSEHEITANHLMSDNIKRI